MINGNSVSKNFPPDFPDRSKYITTTDTAFVAWLDMNHGIRPVSIVINEGNKGIWCLPMSQEEQKAKWILFKESEYYKHHVRHREYLRLLHDVIGDVKESHDNS